MHDSFEGHSCNVIDTNLRLDILYIYISYAGTYSHHHGIFSEVVLELTEKNIIVNISSKSIAFSANELLNFYFTLFRDIELIMIQWLVVGTISQFYGSVEN